jgi:hypothetical protein
VREAKWSKNCSIPAGVNITRMRAGSSPTFWKQCGVPRRHVHERACGRPAYVGVELEAELALEHVPQFVLVRVRVQSRAVAGRDDVLECGQRVTRLLAP